VATPGFFIGHIRGLDFAQQCLAAPAFDCINNQHASGGIMSLQHNRILLKISGEVLMGSQAFGIDLATVSRVADEVIECQKLGAQLALVIGGGNIFRGMAGAAKGMERVSADHMGIMATVMNALAMQGVLQSKGIDARVLSAIAMPTVCETYSAAKGRHHLEKGRVVICAGGTGLPYFTTDTGAALRAAELKCQALYKGTSVDGVYSDDPKKNTDAKRYASITFDEVLAKNLKIMDAAAIALARDNDVPVVVFSVRDAGNVAKVLQGKGNFTRVTKV
jgi:uridylate kinase